MTQQSGLVRLPAMARLLDVSVATLRRWLKDGRVPYYGGDGAGYRFDPEEVLAALRRGPRNQPSE